MLSLHCKIQLTANNISLPAPGNRHPLFTVDLSRLGEIFFEVAMKENESVIPQNVCIVKMYEKTINDSSQENKTIIVAAGSTGIDLGKDSEAITLIDVEGCGPVNIKCKGCDNSFNIQLYGDAELRLIIEAFKSIVEILELTLPQDIAF